MRRLWLWLVIPSVVLAQSSGRTILLTNKPTAGAQVTADAGTPRSSADAGVSAEPLRVPSTASQADLDRVRKEVTELRAKVADLELRLAKAESQAARVDKLESRLDSLEKRVTEAEEEKATVEREAAQRKANHAQANTTVQSVLQKLSLGDVSSVDAWLRSAEGQYSGNPSKLVALARQSLAQQDLVAARQYLVLALVEAGP